MTRSPRYLLPMTLALLVLACGTDLPLPAGADLSGALIDRQDDSPPTEPEGACWAGAVIPAVFETVTEQVRDAGPRRAPDGTTAAPATFRTETRQEMVSDRRSVWFQTPCPDALTPDLIASLQRALKARGVYLAAITGVLDAETSRAIRAWQRPRGLDSDVLALGTAQAMGLMPGEF